MNAVDVDGRLSGVLTKVRAGEFYETTVESFRLTYFPALTDLETMDALGQWCNRNGIEPDLQEQRVEIGGKSVKVVYLLLTLR